ncbi:uncharacterized protein LOC142518697 [Primulina tabacum]|uniref:uncharacterized protein LOC142518697 n=1 Tax=Primulina tabacum TaxID=48773 RepID=UPI003F5A868D
MRTMAPPLFLLIRDRGGCSNILAANNNRMAGKIQASAAMTSRTRAAMVIVSAMLARQDGHHNSVLSRGGVRFLTGGGLSGLLPPTLCLPKDGARPPTATFGPGVLGPRPQQQAYQAFTAPVAPSFNGQTGSYVPTDIASAMHTMTLNPPDPTWYMDTCATSHMTSSNGFSDGDASTEV